MSRPTAAHKGGQSEAKSSAREAARTCRLYLITPPALDPVTFAPRLEAAFAGGDVACLQLRLKDVDDRAVLTAAAALAPICRAHDVALLINDRPDLAIAAGADGVHIGQEDATYAEARATVGADAIVGVTCHNSRHLALAAAEAGADYVAFGAFYPTATKTPKTRATTDLLAWWQEMIEVPCVAIGGITAANCGPLVTAGADFIAVASAVWDDPAGPAAAVAAINRSIRGALDAITPGPGPRPVADKG